MQIENQPVKKATLLSDDGELKNDLAGDDLALLDAEYEKPKKNKESQDKSYIATSDFWTFSILFTGTFYILVSFVDKATGNVFLVGIIALIVSAIYLIEMGRYWRTNRRIALGFLGGLVGSLVVVPIMAIFGYAFLSWLINLILQNLKLHKAL